VTFGLVWTGPALMALGAFQAAVVVAILFHLLRQRASVSLAERRAADMLALAFALALPLLATDFAWAFPDLPFRGGPFAALVFVLACSRLSGTASRPLRLLGDLALIAGAGGLTALAAAPAALALAMAATASAAAALVLLAERFADPSARGEGLLLPIARAAPDEAAILAAHPLLANAVPVTPEALADLPADLVSALAARPVVTAARDPSSETLTGAARELLARYGASHLLRLAPASAPALAPRFLAISGGALDEARLTQELTIVARLLERAP